MDGRQLIPACCCKVHLPVSIGFVSVAGYKMISMSFQVHNEHHNVFGDGEVTNPSDMGLKLACKEN